MRRTAVSGGISKEQLREALSGDFESLLEKVVEAGKSRCSRLAARDMAAKSPSSRS
jgi:hypothetical protein